MSKQQIPETPKSSILTLEDLDELQTTVIVNVIRCSTSGLKRKEDRKSRGSPHKAVKVTKSKIIGKDRTIVFEGI